MKRKDSIPMRTDPEFRKEIRDMQTKRLQMGKDKPLEPKSPRRLTLAMTRHQLFKKMKMDIIDADLT